MKNHTTTESDTHDNYSGYFDQTTGKWFNNKNRNGISHCLGNLQIAVTQNSWSMYLFNPCCFSEGKMLSRFLVSFLTMICFTNQDFNLTDYSPSVTYHPFYKQFTTAAHTECHIVVVIVQMTFLSSRPEG